MRAGDAGPGRYHPRVTESASQSPDGPGTAAQPRTAGPPSWSRPARWTLIALVAVAIGIRTLRVATQPSLYIDALGWDALPWAYDGLADAPRYVQGAPLAFLAWTRAPTAAI